MWQHLAHLVGAGKVSKVSAAADYVEEGGLSYDKLMAANLQTESGLVGRCIQDVVTRPARKWARVQGEDGFVEWEYGGAPGKHVVRYCGERQNVQQEEIEARRPEDFIAEVCHLEGLLNGEIDGSPIDISQGSIQCLSFLPRIVPHNPGKAFR